ncbi:uncharacterized protein LOC116714035 [Xiphophorus hellerii]|uniref:uncharacterized protein LOC116714035 n=1 Tax=Xiphophorus hellerii TaxID=8084 RepID=UPI0013B43990|nr:uncharacterized protein LOC116714035 [Xiphophorus hellerii]
MYKPKEKGGKGVPVLYLFLGSHYTSTHLKQAMNLSSNNKTNTMTRFWCGSYLRKLKMIKSDFRTPVAFNLPPAYVFIWKFLEHFKLEGEESKILTNHRFIISVVQDRESVTPVRGLRYGDASTVWRNVSHPVLSNRLQDLSWMVAHGILPVRAVMHSRGMSATSICPRPGCGAPESVRHLLWECSAAVDLWAKAGSLQFPHLAREVLHGQLVLYGVSQQKITKKDFAEMWLTLATIKDAIWTSRNLLVSRRRQMPPVAVKRNIKGCRWRAKDTATKKNRLRLRGRRSRRSTNRGPSSGGLALRVRQEGRSFRAGFPSEHQRCLEGRDGSGLGKESPRFCSTFNTQRFCILYSCS